MEARRRPECATVASRGGRSRVRPRPDPRGCVAPDDQLRRRGADARDRPAGRRARRGLPGLGREGLAGRGAAAWPAPCPVRVKLTRGEAGGLTSFGFAGGRVTDQEIRVEGRLDRILASGLPHEVTHTVFAAYFGGPMPRWADEGASLLSEDTLEHRRHDQIVDDLLARRGDLPLGRLFKVEDYPSDLMGFYGQGYSISRFLVEMGGRPRFLQFVRDGMTRGWDVRLEGPLRPRRRPRARPRLARLAQGQRRGRRLP